MDKVLQQKYILYSMIEHFPLSKQEILIISSIKFWILLFLFNFFYPLYSRHWDHIGVTKELHLQFPSNKVTTLQELQFSETVTHILIKHIKGHLSNARKGCGSLPSLLFPVFKWKQWSCFKWVHAVLFTNFNVLASHRIDIMNEVFWTSSVAPGTSSHWDLWQIVTALKLDGRLVWHRARSKKIIILYNNHILMLIVTFPELNDMSRISLTRLYNLTRQHSWKEKNIGFCHNSIKYTQFEWLMNGTLLLPCLNFSSMVGWTFELVSTCIFYWGVLFHILNGCLQ